MLTFNFDRILKARGIFRPYNFLLKQGYSSNTAYRISRNIGDELNLKRIERLCILFKCTPNDLLEWTPEKNDTDIENHPLLSLKRENKVTELNKLLYSIPLDKLENIKAMIQEEIKK
ncbi:MAG: hypothetical protein H6Q17_32 [Bacteroidetes bacterium]|jgi:DNA-binding Xre family transcriptional regulator|nr:hypothetical protein [Bacteroidota bacterium]